MKTDSPGYVEAVTTLFGQLVIFAEAVSAQLHLGRREAGGWTVALEWVVEVDGVPEQREASGIGEGIGEALATVVRDCGLGEGDPTVVPTIPTDLATAYVNGRNAGYEAAKQAFEEVLKGVASELAEARHQLEVARSE